MADTEAQAVIDQSLALSPSHPHVHALAVLDLAMQGREGLDLHFEATDPNYSDWLDPPSPFGELLRRAFAADKIRADAAALWVSTDPAHLQELNQLVDEWEAFVVNPFAARYRLWTL